jgi:hypothetical protein
MTTHEQAIEAAVEAWYGYNPVMTEQVREDMNRAIRAYLAIAPQADKDMHRRAQKAEGAVAAVRAVLAGWEKTFEGRGAQLPQHDFLIKTVRCELEKAIARAKDAVGVSSG